MFLCFLLATLFMPWKFHHLLVLFIIECLEKRMTLIDRIPCWVTDSSTKDSSIWTEWILNFTCGLYYSIVIFKASHMPIKTRVYTPNSSEWILGWPQYIFVFQLKIREVLLITKLLEPKICSEWLQGFNYEAICGCGALLMN